MGSGFKKETVDMGNYAPNDREQDAKNWCIKNKIFISPTAKNASEWYLTITINGKDSQSPSSYKKIDIWKQLYKFYVYYYDKYANKIDVKTVEDPKSKLKKEVEKPNNNLKLF